MERRLLIGTMEKFQEDLEAERGKHHKANLIRLRAALYNRTGELLDELRIPEEGNERIGFRIPFSASHGEVVFEEQLENGQWQEYKQEILPVSRFSVKHFERLLAKLLRSLRLPLWHRALVCTKLILIRYPKIGVVLFGKLWRRYVEEADKSSPREAWSNGFSAHEQTYLWALTVSKKQNLGKLYQYPANSGPVYDQLPRVENREKPLPKLTVVTPSYNQGHFLAETMDSVIQSDRVELDYIVMDGGSTDESVEMIRQREDRLKYWQSQRDGGQAAAIHEGFKHIDCGPDDVMAYLNSDDLFCPGTVEFVLSWFAEHPEVDVVYGHRIIIDENGKEVGRWVLPPHDPEVLAVVDFVPQETLFWRRRVYDLVEGFDPSFHFAMDWDFLLRLMNAGAKFERLPWFLGCFRVHPSQKTQANIDGVGAQEIEALRTRQNGGSQLSAETLRKAVMQTQVESLWYTEKLKKEERY